MKESLSSSGFSNFQDVNSNGIDLDEAHTCLHQLQGPKPWMRARGPWSATRRLLSLSLIFYFCFYQIYWAKKWLKTRLSGSLKIGALWGFHVFLRLSGHMIPDNIEWIQKTWLHNPQNILINKDEHMLLNSPWFCHVLFIHLTLCILNNPLSTLWVFKFQMSSKGKWFFH